MTPEEFDEEFEASETNGESGEPKKKYLNIKRFSAQQKIINPCEKLRCFTFID